MSYTNALHGWTCFNSSFILHSLSPPRLSPSPSPPPPAPSPLSWTFSGPIIWSAAIHVATAPACRASITMTKLKNIQVVFCFFAIANCLRIPKKNTRKTPEIVRLLLIWFCRSLSKPCIWGQSYLTEEQICIYCAWSECDGTCCSLLTWCIHLHIPRVGGALPVPADVGPEPPVPASLAAPHALAIDYEGPIASVATFGISVDVAGANLANWICALIGTHIITALVCASKTMTKLTNI